MQKKNVSSLCRVLIFGFFPLLCAWLWCIREGQSISDVFLPASYWNDELMYYKQVESVVSCGLPGGWFGFNEAHGSVYPFAAWSPVILLPWILWGKLFGWNLLSPVYANIFFNMAALAVFALSVRPNLKQSCFFLGLLFLFTPYTRYMLSGMPETLCMSLVICYTGMCISCARRMRVWKIGVMTGIVVFLTLSRPYIGLLFLLPLFFLWRRFGLRGILGAVAVMAGTAAGYVGITGACCSPYIEAIVETEWLKTFTEEGFLSGAGYVLATLTEKFSYLFSYFLKRAVKYGLFSGALYAVTGLIALLLFVRFLWALRQKQDGEMKLFCAFQMIVTAGMILALFLFYRMGEGSKHLMIFIVMGLVWIAMLEEKRYLLKGITAALCMYFFWVKASAPYDWQVPYGDQDLRQEASVLEEELSELLIPEEADDRFDNTVIWLASDMVNGESIAATWGLLYMIPDGFGINFCTQQYVMENQGQLKSRYIALLPGGEVEEILKSNGAVPVAGSEHMRVYRLR